MRLTALFDYALRVLLHAEACGGRLVTVEETCCLYAISRGHVMKVVNILARAGYLRSVRGRAGGYTLARRPSEINLGAVMRLTEPGFALTECFAPENRCRLTRCCRLPSVLNAALAAFVRTLDGHTLADIALAPDDFLAPPPAAGQTRGPNVMDMELS